MTTLQLAEATCETFGDPNACSPNACSDKPFGTLRNVWPNGCSAGAGGAGGSTPEVGFSTPIQYLGFSTRIQYEISEIFLDSVAGFSTQ